MNSNEFIAETRQISANEGDMVVFDDMSDSNQKVIYPFLTRRRQKDLDVFTYPNLTLIYQKRTMRNESNINILLNQTSKDVENLYMDIGGIDIRYEEFQELCREAWKD